MQQLHQTKVYMHVDVIEPFLELKKVAGKQGFDLRIASGFRSYDRQRKIWNEKCLGLRPVLDDQGRVVDVRQLTGLEKITHILRWSALPGTSRHHWGTDFDIYDAAAVDKDYKLQLVVGEYTGRGPFAPMTQWLLNYLPESDFFQPYNHDRGGVAPEPWHISYRPLAEGFMQQLSLSVLREKLISLMQLPNKKLEEHEMILDNLDMIYETYVQNIM